MPGGGYYLLPDPQGSYVNPQGERVRLRGVDDLRVVADEQLRQLRRIDVPLTPMGGVQVFRPDSLGAVADAQGLIPDGRLIRAADYLPGGTLPDGTRSAVAALSRALAACKRLGYGLDLRGGIWRVDLLNTLSLHSDLVIWLDGGKILGPQTVSSRGVLFTGANLDNVRLVGGEVVGFRDAWDAPVAGQDAKYGSINALGRNVRAFAFTGSTRLELDGVRMRDFNAPAFSADGGGDVTLRNVRFTRNSAYYYDYIEATQPYVDGNGNTIGGPAWNSTEADKGQYHLWDLDRFQVLGCVVEGSRGDSSHVKNATQGNVVGNSIVGNKMGGAYYEACGRVNIASNYLWSNGSRGTTVEANSTDMNFVGNIVGDSGRQGYWGWGVTSGTIVGNIFKNNGRKGANGDTNTQNILMSNFKVPRGATLAQTDVLIAHNYSEADLNQSHNIEVGWQIDGVVVRSNMIRGPMRRIHVAPWFEGLGRVRVEGNDGWATESRGRVTLTGDGSKTTFDLPHGLDIASAGILNFVRIQMRLTPYSAAAAAPAFISVTDAAKAQLTFLTAPANNAQITLDWDAAYRPIT